MNKCNHISDNIRKELQTLVSNAEIASWMLNKGTTIPECNTKQLTELLSRIDTAQSAIETLTKVFPNDKDIEQFKSEMTKYYNLGDKSRTIFLNTCMCKKKI